MNYKKTQTIQCNQGKKIHEQNELFSQETEITKNQKEILKLKKSMNKIKFKKKSNRDLQQNKSKWKK